MLSDQQRAVAALKALKLGPMAARLEQWAEDPASLGRSHADCILALVDAQTQATATKRAGRFLAQADLPLTITLADIQPSAARGLPAQLLFNLATGDWIQRGHTLLITGETQAGKTYLAAALAREAALHRVSVAYRRTPELLAECAMEKTRGTWPAFLKRLGRMKLLVLDDFATERANSPQSHALREILDLRRRHNSAVLIASPNAPEDWDGFFDDPTAAEAIFGRVLERSQHIALKRPARAA